jgi:PAS domain S-box-containing protein
MERHVIPLRNSAGAVTHFLGMQRDVTERRRAEEELRLKTAVLEAQVNSSLDAIIVVDPQGRKTLQNGRTAELFKIPASILLNGTDAQQLEWVTGMAANPRQFADKVAYLYSHPNEISRDEIALKDGTILDRYSSPVIGSGGECYGRIWTYRDITARHQVENALRESNQKFLMLAENITDVFWIRSPDWREVLYVSPGFERLWGLPSKQLYANPQQWDDTIVPEDRDRVVAAFATLTDTAPSISIEYRIERPDGDRRWVHGRGFQVRDASGKLCRLTGVITDITERKQSEAQLAAAHKELVDISRHAGMAEIATNVLHNVGNILNSVNVSAALIDSMLRSSRTDNLARAVDMLNEHSADLGDFLARDPKGNRLPAYLGRLAQALAKERSGMAGELAHLMRSIEHIKDVVATQQSFACAAGVVEPSGVCELVEDALRMTGDALVKKGVTVVREFAAVPVMRLDRARVSQILVNLISNARHAMEGMPRELRLMTLRVEAVAGSWLRVSVKDDGEGIPPENLTRIFAHGFTTRKAGHGFGLHSSALAARQMGGTLTVHSEGAGHGATFTLELPIDLAEAPT